MSVQWEPSACRSCQCCQKKGPSKVCVWICSVWPSWVWESQHVSTGNSVFWSLGHSSRSSFHRMVFFPSLKQNFIAYCSSKVQIVFLKFTSCDNQALVGCVVIADSLMKRLYEINLLLKQVSDFGVGLVWFGCMAYQPL